MKCFSIAMLGALASTTVAGARSCFVPMLLSAVAPFAAGCGASDDGAEQQAEDVGNVRLAVTTVPATIQCIRVTAVANTSTVKTFAVTAGGSAMLDMSRLPAAVTLFMGEAFDVACASIGTALPVWEADPTNVTIERGAVSLVTLDFRKRNAVTVAANFIGNIRKFATGDNATFLATDLGVYRAGASFTQMDAPQWTLQSTFVDVVDLAGGSFGNGTHTCAVRTDGSVWCWGNNNAGQLGNGTNTSSIAPVRAGTITGMSVVAVGSAHTCASGVNGTYCWGDNSQGQLGTGTAGGSSTTPVLNTTRFKLLSSRKTHTLGVTEGGLVMAWGRNAEGQIGDNTTTVRPGLTFVNGGQEAPVRSIAAGDSSSCAVRVDGSVRCWGANTFGQLGDGTTVNSLVPKLVIGLGTEAVEVTAGIQHACARLTTNEVKCWGYNVTGQLGDRTLTLRTSPVLTGNGVIASTIVAGGSHTCAMHPTLALYCWGYNGNGQLANGTRNNAFIPTKVLFVP